MAYIFGKEDLESSALPATFDSDASWGGGSVTRDATSKVNGTYSLRTAMTAEGNGSLLKTLGTSYSELWFQRYIFIPTAFAWGSASYLNLMSVTTSGDVVVLDLNMEDWGSIELTLWTDGSMGWIDTGLTLSKNTLYRLEGYIKVAGASGIVKLWINNTTEASPTYTRNSSNMGSTNMQKFYGGVGYSDAGFTNYIYEDDFIVNNAFIGAGVSSSIKTVLGLAKASVKTVNGLAIASVKSINGLT